MTRRTFPLRFRGLSRLWGTHDMGLVERRVAFHGTAHVVSLFWSRGLISLFPLTGLDVDNSPIVDNTIMHFCSTIWLIHTLAWERVAS